MWKNSPLNWKKESVSITQKQINNNGNNLKLRLKYKVTEVQEKNQAEKEISAINNYSSNLPNVCVCVCVSAQLLSCVLHFTRPWMVAHEVTLPMEFPRQETGVGCYLLFQGISLIQRWNLHLFLCLLHWQVDSLTTGPPGKPPLNYLKQK